MNRLAICGFLMPALVAAAALPGCAQSIEEQRNLGIDYYQRSHFPEAEAQFKRIVDRRPDTESYYYLARIHHAQGQYPKAIFQYQNALTMDPGHIPARAWLNRALQEYPAGKALLFIPEPGQPPGTSAPE
jgi:tetratricopeptide (TPR) repeat protein